MQNSYRFLSAYYDRFTGDVGYPEWADYCVRRFREAGITPEIVLDLACGTGRLCAELAVRGYDMIGVDSADDMLEIALRKKERSGHDILYLSQDMREFELYGTVRAIVSICDSMNYLMEYEELVQVLRLANNYLDPGGIFLFDFNTQYKYENILGNRTFAEDRDECSFIWNNFYYEEDRVNEYELTLFIRDGDAGGLYRKFQETHYQRGYTLEEIKGLIEKSGLEFVEAYDAYTKKPVSRGSERILAVAREKGKSKC